MDEINLLTEPVDEAESPTGGQGRDRGKPQVPAKFRDPETGEIRVEALLKSYLELERKLARMVEVPGADAGEDARIHFRRAVGIPDTPEEYEITPPHELIDADPEVNRQLHEAGFTPAQVQLVYDLAGERLLPAIDVMSSEFEADRQLDRLIDHFGGEDKWREVAAALGTWGKSNLPPEVFEALSTTFEGVLAMHRMMAGGEPGLVQDAMPAGALGENELRRLMADPRYWRDRDPGVVKQVSDGFRRLFPGSIGT
ncbi:capsid assembly protein [Ferruginivarius sediminum]|uniref:Uncharacterized protein n=1 Tax=Ferruginivarius sediminum TaxID=2661937 RepID=A0A369T9A0_9PROT|nr:hypothetical protein [Ferruginivarius sediminum]RDD61064.1 hypothetical protein DRB17_15185 [Ferruginivarius sediminum]